MPDAEFDRAVEQAAAQRELARNTQDVFDAGVRDYQDFRDSLNIMAAVGATSDEFAADLVAVDKANAHKIIHELAQNPELSKRLAAMSYRQRVAELTKMSLTLRPAVGGKQIVRAGTSAAPAGGSAGTDDTDLSDSVSDDEWSARFDKRYGGRK
jgi:hypothetical protein